MKKIAILGSTGSIGNSTLEVARHLKDQIEVTALAARTNIDILEKQAKEFHPQIIAVFDEEQARKLQKRLPQVEVVAGMEGLKTVASHHDVDFVVSAIAGTIGLEPTLAAIHANKDVGLANKEALVSGGALVMSLVREKNIKLIPIDSEHNAIFQCLQGEKKEAVRKLILTASGGPFRQYSPKQLQNISVEQALSHPTWKMGPKVTIDSSTLMNKGLEVIEAHWLFDMPVEKIDVMVHPQSIVHSMVEFVDCSLLAQLGRPDMISPIQYALTHPLRQPTSIEPFNFMENNTLQFYPPNLDHFRCLRLAFDAIKHQGTLPCYMNAANEVLVHRFLRKEITWWEIATKLEALMETYTSQEVLSLETLLEVDSQARRDAKIK